MRSKSDINVTKEYRIRSDYRLLGTIYLLLLVTLLIFSYVQVPVITTIHAYTFGMLFGHFSVVIYIVLIYYAICHMFNGKMFLQDYFLTNMYSGTFVVSSFILFTVAWEITTSKKDYFAVGATPWFSFVDWWDHFTTNSDGSSISAWYPDSYLAGVYGTFLYALTASIFSSIGSAIISIFALLICFSYLFFGRPVALYVYIWKYITSKTDRFKVEKGSKSDVTIDLKIVRAEKEYIAKTNEKSRLIKKPNSLANVQKLSELNNQIGPENLVLQNNENIESGNQVTKNEDFPNAANLENLASPSIASLEIDQQLDKIASLDNFNSYLQQLQVSLNEKGRQAKKQQKAIGKTLLISVKKDRVLIEKKLSETSKDEIINAQYAIDDLPFDNPLSTQEIKAPKKYFISSAILNEPKSDLASKTIMNETNLKAELLNKLFEDFKINAKVIDKIIGPTLTKYIIKPGPNVNLKKIAAVEDNIKMNLAATSIRMELPIPGQSFIGVECPNSNPRMVTFKEVYDQLDDHEFSKFTLPAALGILIDGKPLIVDISKTPHFLIAGATGSGKSVGINSIIISLIMKLSPFDVSFILIDPKMVEFTPYHGTQHLYQPIITNPEDAASALDDVVELMEERYRQMASFKVRKFEEWNENAEKNQQAKWPYLVIIIDELADLMNVAKKTVEVAIQRITQKARAAGIHLIVATQRPSTDVVTGVIKANIPSRMAFAVSSSIDSKVILDSVGAEKLLGQGDLLISLYGKHIQRAQGAYLSNGEIEKVAQLIQGQGPYFHIPKPKKKIEPIKKSFYVDSDDFDDEDE